MAAAGVAGIASFVGGNRANKARAREAQKDRNFQERMRDSSWQAGVADMRSAGINPALAYSQGGASSPSGAMAQQSDVVSPAVNSAQAQRRQEKELKLMDTQEMKAYEDARLSRAQAGQSAAMTQLVYRNQRGQELSNELAALNMFSARNVAKVEQSFIGKGTAYGRNIRQIFYGGNRR